MPDRSRLAPDAILLAEDETIIRLDLRELLERTRATRSSARRATGRRRSRSHASAQPDLAVMDVKMPRLDGIEAARKILGSGRCRS